MGPGLSGERPCTLALHAFIFLLCTDLSFLLDALSYIQNNRAVINPAFMRLIILSFFVDTLV